MNKPIACAALGAAFLSACNLSEVAVTTETALAGIEEHGIAPAGLEVTYDEGSDAITVDDGTTATVLPRDAFMDGDRFRAYYQDNSFAFYAPAASGEAFAALALVYGGTVDAAVYGRTAETALPGTGTASYSGEYASMLVNDADGDPFRLIYGQADLAADFGDGTISGVISNRADFSNPDISFADVTLSEAALSNGRFSGGVSGGSGNGIIVTTASDGTYQGMIVGPNGEEVVGGVIIPHLYGPDEVTEYGAFIGD